MDQQIHRRIRRVAVAADDVLLRRHQLTHCHRAGARSSVNMDARHRRRRHGGTRRQGQAKVRRSLDGQRTRQQRHHTTDAHSTKAVLSVVIAVIVVVDDVAQGQHPGRRRIGHRALRELRGFDRCGVRRRRRVGRRRLRRGATCSGRRQLGLGLVRADGGALLRRLLGDAADDSEMQRHATQGVDVVLLLLLLVLLLCGVVRVVVRVFVWDGRQCGRNDVEEGAARPTRTHTVLPEVRAVEHAARVAGVARGPVLAALRHQHVCSGVRHNLVRLPVVHRHTRVLGVACAEHLHADALQHVGAVEVHDVRTDLVGAPHGGVDVAALSAEAARAAAGVRTAHNELLALLWRRLHPTAQESARRCRLLLLLLLLVLDEADPVGRALVLNVLCAAERGHDERDGDAERRREGGVVHFEGRERRGDGGDGRWQRVRGG
eukprot:PhM_4_TR13947/c2_g2_i2/m.5284